VILQLLQTVLASKHHQWLKGLMGTSCEYLQESFQKESVTVANAYKQDKAFAAE